MCFNFQTICNLFILRCFGFNLFKKDSDDTSISYELQLANSFIFNKTNMDL